MMYIYLVKAGRLGQDGAMSSRAFDALSTELDRCHTGSANGCWPPGACELAANGGLATLAGEADGVFEREIVLFLAVVAGDSTLVARVLRDGNWRLRALALGACRLASGTCRSISTRWPRSWPTRLREMRKRIYRLVRLQRLTACGSAVRRDRAGLRRL